MALPYIINYFMSDNEVVLTCQNSITQISASHLFIKSERVIPVPYVCRECHPSRW